MSVHVGSADRVQIVSQPMSAHQQPGYQHLYCFELPLNNQFIFIIRDPSVFGNSIC